MFQKSIYQEVKRKNQPKDREEIIEKDMRRKLKKRWAISYKERLKKNNKILPHF